MMCLSICLAAYSLTSGHIAVLFATYTSPVYTSLIILLRLYHYWLLCIYNHKLFFIIIYFTDKIRIKEVLILKLKCQSWHGCWNFSLLVFSKQVRKYLSFMLAKLDLVKLITSCLCLYSIAHVFTESLVYTLRMGKKMGLQAFYISIEDWCISYVFLVPCNGI